MRTIKAHMISINRDQLFTTFSPKTPSIYHEHVQSVINMFKFVSLKIEEAPKKKIIIIIIIIYMGEKNLL